jgi:hypothetical protein
MLLKNCPGKNKLVRQALREKAKDVQDLAASNLKKQ